MLGTLTQAVESYPGNIAIKDAFSQISYCVLWENIEALSKRIKKNQAGQRCLLISRNSHYSVTAFYALVKCGIAPFLADPAWSYEHCKIYASGYGITHIIVDNSSDAWRLDNASFLTDDGMLSIASFDDSTEVTSKLITVKEPFFARFTSGSTGRPRALAFGEDAAITAAENWSEAAGIEAGTRVLCLASLNNGLSFNTSLLSVFMKGAMLIYHAGPLLPGVLTKTLLNFNPHIMVAFPFIYEMLCSKKERLLLLKEKVKFAVSSSALLPQEVIDSWTEATNIPIKNYYGVAELGPVTFSSKMVKGSVGQAIRGVDMIIVDDNGQHLPRGEQGKVAVKTKSAALSYLDERGADYLSSLNAAGYYVTKDLGIIDKQGYLFIKGRSGAVINISGQKIDPKEIEDCLENLKGISKSVVTAEKGTNRIYLCAHVETQSVTEEDIRIYCGSQLLPSRIPTVIRIYEKMPRSAAGKVQFSELIKGTQDE
ncbi:class I adenylate-forming enzyme family protein [Erwinia piriflorinigrans]|uniref:AMP-dependent synthetase and ligase n=1 Tax=Erwinia piriflorinigrans CFBP 5888 TaxID=1161919 RepID=V5Z8D7_9GAMM|nr:class I adenylate-forming enzyme family protein [Erwinia piriflorinigrans]CCG87612.1 AMP-dependent synthetase and ligase [Erwinia piriflorinigrans CFBP 5888]